jgi:hypothetical protein
MTTRTELIQAAKLSSRMGPPHMSARVDQDEPVFRLESMHVSQLVPGFGTFGEAMKENQRCSVAFDTIANS